LQLSPCRSSINQVFPRIGSINSCSCYPNNLIQAALTPENLLSRFRELQIWTSGAQRAPHKPLLVLWAIGRCLRGEERFASYREVDRELTKLLNRFGPHRKVIHTQAPFWRLQNDDVWEIPGRCRITVGPGGDAHKKSLLQENAHGGFPKDIQDTLKDNHKLAFQLATSLVDSHFPPSMRDEVLRSVDINHEYEYSRRRRRDPSFPSKVLTAYDFQCAVCNFAVRVNGEPVALEAAHIRWHEARGPDEVHNGLALCALHHRLFDKGAFTLSRDRKVIVSKCAESKGFDSSLGQFDSKPIVLPASSDDWPAPTFLKWHFNEVFNSSTHADAST